MLSLVPTKFETVLSMFSGGRSMKLALTAVNGTYHLQHPHMHVFVLIFIELCLCMVVGFTDGAC